jgi:hypothetical protein
MMPACLQKIHETNFIMKRSILRPTHPAATIVIFVAGICAVASVNLQANELQVGRYSLYAATPTEAQIDLLS